MKASELRIGNWVFNEYTREPQQTYPMMIAQIASIEKEGKEVNMSGVPISEEWLYKFGFKKGDNNSCSDSFYEIAVGGSKLQINPDNGVVWITRNENIFNNPVLITTIHQLQNLYFSLTGKELSI